MSQRHSNSTGFVNAPLSATANIVEWGNSTSETIRILVNIGGGSGGTRTPPRIFAEGDKGDAFWVKKRLV